MSSPIPPTLLENGFTDISPALDGRIFLRVHNKALLGSASPQEGCPTLFHYIGYLIDPAQLLTVDHSLVFESTRDVVDGKSVGGTDNPVEVQLFRPSVKKPNPETQNIDQTLERPDGIGIDIALSHMTRGQTADVVILDPELAYGATGHPPKVLPNSPVRFHLELLSWSTALPKFPSPEELAATRKQREEEERKQLEENPPPSFSERLAIANEERAKGNGSFRAGDFEGAKKHYDLGFVNLFYSTEEYQQLLSESEREQLNEGKHLLHLNRALCKLKLDKVDDALWDCDKALEFKPSNEKALYRRAMVYISKLEGELHKETSGQFWIVDHAWEFHKKAKADLDAAGSCEDPKVRSAHKKLGVLEKKLSAYTKRYHQQEKELYRDKIFKTLDQQNKRLQQKTGDTENQNENVYEDMPELDE